MQHPHWVTAPHVQLPPGFQYHQTHGWLYPHHLAIQSLGAGSDYHLRKNFQRLLLGRHYLKIKGPDNIQRIFYTIAGLKMLCEMVRTQQTFHFSQHLQTLEQNPEFPQLPSYGSSTHTQQSAPLTVYQGEFVDPSGSGFADSFPGNFSGHSPYPLASPASPTDLGMMPPEMPQTQQPPPEISPQISEREAIAQTIFEAQGLVRDSILQAQSQQFVHSSYQRQTLWDQADEFFKQQDTFAISMILSGVFCVLLMGTYGIVSYLRSPAPEYRPAQSSLSR